MANEGAELADEGAELATNVTQGEHPEETKVINEKTEGFLDAGRLGQSKWLTTHEECIPYPKNATFGFYVYNQRYPPILGRWYAEILEILRKHPKRVRDPENATHFFPAFD
eukprot:3386708-Pyramimonas_sp.AAC.2